MSEEVCSPWKAWRTCYLKEASHCGCGALVQKERLSKGMSLGGEGGGTVKDLGSLVWEPGYDCLETFADARVVASGQLRALGS